MTVAGSGLRCATTGLEIVARREWTHANPRTGFSASVAVVGGCLVTVRASGYADLEDVKESVRITIDAIEAGVTGDRYVHIADYHGLRGASMQGRRHFIGVMKGRRRLRALIFCGLNPLMRFGVRLGERFNPTHFGVIVEKDYRSAALRGMQLLGLPVPSPTGAVGWGAGEAAFEAGMGTIRSDPAWELARDGFRTVFQVIDGDTLHSVSAGRFEESHVEPVAELRHRVARDCGLAEGFAYVIADVTTLRVGSRAARRRYLQSLREWQQQYPCRGLYFCGASRAIQAGGFLSRAFLPLTIGFARDLDDALVKVRQHRRQSERRRGVEAPGDDSATHRRYADELLRYLGTLEWGAAGTSEPGDVPSSHPYYEVFEGIRLVLTELDEQVRERQRIMEEVRHERLRLMTLVDNLPDGVVLVDAGNRIVLVNRAAEGAAALLDGFAPGDELRGVGGRPLSQVDAACEKKGWIEVSAGEPQRIFLVSSRKVPEGGRALVLRDVTSEQNMRRQLEQQERLAAVGQLAAGVAHDFNNMLQDVALVAELLKTGERAPETVNRYAAQIADRCDRGALLIRRILDFSRKSISRRRSLDLCASLAEMERLLRRVIPESIAIELLRPPSPLRIRGDQAQVQQLVTNLAVNARDAMPSGGVLTMSLDSTRVEADRRPPIAGMPPGEWIELRFTDTGSGIAQEHLPHIFEPFFTTKKGEAGSGMGLAQVYGIVRQHDGFIDVFSRAGQGTTVVIYLPQLPESPVEDRIDSGDVMQVARGETVLVVEDDEGVLQSVAMALEEAGFRVLTACDGQQALALYRDEHDTVAVVLSDVVMPRMGGMALLAELQKIDPAVRVILMSGYPLGEETEQHKTTGNVAWLAKPFTTKKLFGLVQRTLAAE